MEYSIPLPQNKKFIDEVKVTVNVPPEEIPVVGFANITKPGQYSPNQFNHQTGELLPEGTYSNNQYLDQINVNINNKVDLKTFSLCFNSSSSFPYIITTNKTNINSLTMDNSGTWNSNSGDWLFFKNDGNNLFVMLVQIASAYSFVYSGDIYYCRINSLYGVNNFISIYGYDDDNTEYNLFNFREHTQNSNLQYSTYLLNFNLNVNVI